MEVEKHDLSDLCSSFQNKQTAEEFLLRLKCCDKIYEEISVSKLQIVYVICVMITPLIVNVQDASGLSGFTIAAISIPIALETMAITISNLFTIIPFILISIVSIADIRLRSSVTSTDKKKSPDRIRNRISFTMGQLIYQLNYWYAILNL